jgi:hypothetical protein
MVSLQNNRVESRIRVFVNKVNRMVRSAIKFILLALIMAACNLTRDDTTVDVGPTSTPEQATPLPTAPTPGDTPFITITEPAPNADGSPVEVDALGFTVAGQQFGSFENNVVVQALDNEGNVLQEVVTTATGGGMGELTVWEVFIDPGATADNDGTIRAFFTSPQDGSVVAEATLPVIYGVEATG